MKLNEVLYAVDDRIDIEQITNGYLVTVTGSNKTGEWLTYKAFFEDFNEMLNSISVYSEMPKNQ